MWCKKDENLDDVASTIIHKALCLSDIKIVKVIHKSGLEAGSGLLKIELANADDIKKVLKEKQKTA